MKKLFKYLGLGILGMFILFIIIGMSGGSDTSTTNPTVTQNTIPVVEQTQEPDYIVSVAELSAEFENNGLSASQKYEDKLVRVNGVVGNIDEDILGSPYVMIHDPADEYQFDGVQCMFKRGDTSQLTSLSKGERITVEGYLADEVLISILVRNCQVVE